MLEDVPTSTVPCLIVAVMKLLLNQDEAGLCLAWWQEAGSGGAQNAVMVSPVMSWHCRVERELSCSQSPAFRQLLLATSSSSTHTAACKTFWRLM